MAAKKVAPKKGGTKSGSARAPAKKPVPKTVKKEHTAARQIAALCIIAAGILILLGLLFGSTGAFGEFFSSLLMGLFGGGAYAFPAVLVFAGVLLAVGHKKKGVMLKVYTALGFQLLISTFIQVFNTLPTIGAAGAVGYISALFTAGKTGASGGVCGGLIATGLITLFDVTGTVIVLVLLCLIAVVILSGLTLSRMTAFLFPSYNKEPEADNDGFAEEMRDVYAEAAPVTRPSRPRGRGFNIDLPIDDKKKSRREPKSGVNEGFGYEGANSRAAAAVPEDAPPPHAAAESPAFDDGIFTAALAPKPSPKATAAEISGEEQNIAKAVNAALSEDDHPVYIFPSTDLLKHARAGATKGGTEELRINATKIVDTLKSFGVETKIINIAKGPAVTRYELAPSVGVKISKITSLSDDIALSLAAVGVRIEAPIPGKAAVGIEVPNKNVNLVYVRDMLESERFRAAKSKLSFVVGEDLSGQTIVGDIGKMPHMLIAGATGSGKSVCINSLITSILYKATPEEVRLVMIDPKVVELGVYNGIPHLLIPVVTEPKKAAGALNWSLGEMERRYKLFAEKGVRDLLGYNMLAVGDDEVTPMPSIVIIIDELADLMMTSPKEVEDSICRLAQKARAAGMHLVIATQRPSVDVITGTIKANIPSRIAFSVSSSVDSRTILDMGGAEKLLGKGDMLYSPVGTSKPMRVQGCFVSDSEVEAVVAFIKAGAAVDYNQDVIDEINASSEKGGGNSQSSAGDEDDEMLPAAIDVVVDCGMASTSMLQRRLKLGYARAARLIDEMELRGIVGPFEGSKPRTVKITRDEWSEMRMRQDDERQ